jgi:non-canonical purine NTP pyrophosphatase (RdgB/HAM1 family)
VPEAEETGLTFVENAILKARNAARHSGLPAIADDSGLEVDALRGAPGIYSARYAGPGATDEANLRKLLADLAEVPEAERTARFQCVLVYLRHAEDPTPLICQGTWEGRILFEPRGSNGFGYDPIFLVPSLDHAAPPNSTPTPRTGSVIAVRRCDGLQEQLSRMTPDDIAQHRNQVLARIQAATERAVVRPARSR